MSRALLVLVLLSALPAPALGPRDSALLPPAGSASVGVLAPLTYSPSARVQVRTHPLLFLVAPNASVRVALGAPGGVHLAADVGLTVPTLGLRLTQGFLLPAWETSDRQVGLLLVPSVGLRASRAVGTRGLLTLRGDVAWRVPLTHSDTGPLGAPAVLELALAPALGGSRARVGSLVEWEVHSSVRLRAHADVLRYDAGGSPLVLRAGGGVDVGVGRRGRLVLGAAWWNSDQHAYDFVQGRHHRSNDVLPVLDFVWER